LEKEKTFELTPEGLVIHQGDRADEAQYSQIKSVRLYFDPSRFATNKYQCDITLKNGAKILIKSVHYRGPADFEDRGASYQSFLEMLHSHLSSVDGIVFLAGNNPGCFSINVFIIVLTVLLVGIALFTFGSAMGVGIFIRLILLAGLLYLGIKYLKRNRPQEYMPEELPIEVLPD
jgi:hypothetical protein